MASKDKSELLNELKGLCVLLAQVELAETQLSTIGQKIAECKKLVSSALENNASAGECRGNMDNSPAKDGDGEQGIEKSSDSSFSSELLGHINDIQKGKIVALPISERLKKYVEFDHDEIKCIGHIANDDLWIGDGMRKPATDFYAMICYVWKFSPEFFVQYDHERPIIEDKSQWNTEYFGDQLNYLRHNFALERLCHIVMVYDYLYCKDEKRATLSNTKHDVYSSSITSNTRVSSKSHVSHSTTVARRLVSRIADNGIKRIAIGGILLLVIVVLGIAIKGCGGDKPSSPKQGAPGKRDVQKHKMPSDNAKKAFVSPNDSNNTDVIVNTDKI